MTAAELFACARRRRLGRITLEDVGDDDAPEWKATSANLRVPHDARGQRPVDALAELVRFADALERPWWKRWGR